MTDQQMIKVFNLGPYLCFILIGVIIVLIFLLVDTKYDFEMNIFKLKGKTKFRLSILARIICGILSLLFMFLFSWKLGLSATFLMFLVILQNVWKDYGK